MHLPLPIRASMSSLSVHQSPLFRHEHNHAWWTSTFRRRSNTNLRIGIISNNASGHDQKPIIIRRSANYQPPNWDHVLLHSLKNECCGQKFEERSSELKEHVKMMFEQEAINTTVYYLELVDTLQRLGIFYHFEDEIHFILTRLHQQISSSKTTDPTKKDLYETALGFRLLRQHHFDVSQDMFYCFLDAKGEFDTRLSPDINGLVQIYEASFYQKENENILEMGRKFAYKQLNAKLGDKIKLLDEGVQEMVLHSLEQPFHWRIRRLEARVFMDLYVNRPNMNPNLLELAKLDFNTLQASHVNDLKYLLLWWKKARLPEVLPFSRDRLVESLYVAIGVIFQPQFGECRQMLSKVVALITTIDDVYDVYGTLDELELFTQAVERWDKDGNDELPDYMKHCYLVLYNSVNETAANALVLDPGINVNSHFSKSYWGDFCRADLKEAKWYYSGYTPTLEEYLENAWVTIGTPLILAYSYIFVTNPITEKEDMEEIINRYHNIIRCTGIIFRLADDLGTSSDEIERGDNPKAIQCYMNESGASEEEAREHIKLLIGEMWKEMNKHVEINVFDNKEFIEIAMNLARMGQCLYQNGDGFGNQDSITMARISALLFQPLHISN